MIREGKLGKKEQVKENTMELEEQKERREKGRDIIIRKCLLLNDWRGHLF